MEKCPNCGKQLTVDDYDTYFNGIDSTYRMLCSSCGYEEEAIYYDDEENTEEE